VARDAGVIIPACVYSPSGLAEFIFSRRWRSDPRPGDIVFYAFATKQTDPFGMPHVGIVTDSSDWRRNETFKAVEGQVDGSVKITTRGKYETLGFGRPNFKARPGRRRVQTDPVLVRFASVTPGARGRDVVNVQLALVKAVGLTGHTAGVFDSATTRAFARWQRMIGFVGGDANGIPTPASLERLGEITGIFSGRPEN
jgi:peptidoglycan hydrolase-like protein with peptidoglycan-binding domain